MLTTAAGTTPAQRIAHSTAITLATFVAVLALAAPARGQETPLDAWKSLLAESEQGVWIASNAEYRTGNQDPERFGIDWWVLPGGVQSPGCLWGERDGEVTVYWHFQRIWDPRSERGIVYQSSANGTILIGSMDPRSPDEEVIQDLIQPDGTRAQVRHTTRLEGADARVDQSYSRSDTTAPWTADRSYRWVRVHDHPSPCR